MSEMVCRGAYSSELRQNCAASEALELPDDNGDTGTVCAVGAGNVQKLALQSSDPGKFGLQGKFSICSDSSVAN